MKKQGRILLVSANRLTTPYPVYPLGVAYLTTFLKEHLPEYTIGSFDFNMGDESTFADFLNEYKPEYIAVSLRNIDGVNSYDPVNFIGGYKSIMETIRQRYNLPHTTIIGGAGFSIFPEKLFDLLQPDYAVSGEGEISLYQLIRALDSGSTVDSIEGLIYRKDGQVHFRRERSNYTCPDLSFDDQLVEYYWKNSGMLNIQTKRGCPYHCIYCTYPVIEGHTVRTLDAEKVVDALKRLHNAHGIDYVFFTDSVFNMQDAYNKELAERLIQSEINIRWGAYFSPIGMDEKTMELYKRSGLVHVEFGTESISDRTLKNYGKHFTVADIIEQSDICRRLEIDYAHFLILAGYGETDETVDETFENSKRIPHTVFFPFVGMRIYPGTPLYKIALREGVITAEDDLIEPKYYISKAVNLDTLKERAKATGRRWVFPDEDTTAITNRLREKRNKKGPLWEYLIS